MTKKMFYSRVALTLLALGVIGLAAGRVFQSQLMGAAFAIFLFLLVIFLLIETEGSRRLGYLKDQVDTLNRQQLEELDDYIDAKLIKGEIK